MVLRSRRPGPGGSDQASRLPFDGYLPKSRRFRALDLHFHVSKCSNPSVPSQRRSFLEQGFQGQKHHSKGENWPVLELFPPEYHPFPWSGPHRQHRLGLIQSIDDFRKYFLQYFIKLSNALQYLIRRLPLFAYISDD